jgi:hypothetical protein
MAPFSEVVRIYPVSSDLIVYFQLQSIETCTDDDLRTVATHNKLLFHGFSRP